MRRALWGGLFGVLMVGAAVAEVDYAQRLEQMKTMKRGSGEVLLTGEQLVYDHLNHMVRLDGGVVATNDQLRLSSTSLTAYLSESNEWKYVEAERGVVIQSGGRRIEARSAAYDLDAGEGRLAGSATISEGEDRRVQMEKATYNFKSGKGELSGNAMIMDGERRLSGERISFVAGEQRTLVCEPNALLVVPSLSANGTNESGLAEWTEIRADRLLFDEAASVAELRGAVRVRDPRASMNCGVVKIGLKEGQEIDWLEAESKVIIQLGDRKGLAGRASFQAEAGMFVLEDDPKVMQKKNIMTGDRITIWHETQRMVCEPNARVLLYPDAETQARFLEDLND